MIRGLPVIRAFARPRKETVVKDFKAFLLRGNLVDMAVGIVIGVAFGAVIAAFVADIVTPLIAAIFGKPDFSQLSFTINGSRFDYGLFLNALICLRARRDRPLLPRDQAGERTRRPRAHRAAGRPDDAQLPRVPERDPDRSEPLRVLHDGGGPGRCLGRVGAVGSRFFDKRLEQAQRLRPPRGARGRRR